MGKSILPTDVRVNMENNNVSIFQADDVGFTFNLKDKYMDEDSMDSVEDVLSDVVAWAFNLGYATCLGRVNSSQYSSGV